MRSKDVVLYLRFTVFDEAFPAPFVKYSSERGGSLRYAFFT